MFLGFFKEGISLMLLFFGLIGLADWLYLDAIYYPNIVVWFYAFFDALNKNDLPDQEFAEAEDRYLFVEAPQDLRGISIDKHRTAIATALIILGLYLLGNNIISILASLGFAISYELHEFLTHYLPQMITALLIIAAGLWLMAGKRSDLEGHKEEIEMDGGEER